MAGNKQNIPVTDFWEEFLLRDGYDTGGTLRAKFFASTDSIVDNEDGTHTFNFSDGTEYTFIVNDITNISYSGGNIIFQYADGTTNQVALKALRDNNPIINNNDGTYTFHFTDGTVFTTADFDAKDIVSGTGTLVGDDAVLEFTRKDNTNLQVTVTDARGPMGFRGFQGAYPVTVYRVGTTTSDYTGALVSTFDTEQLFSQDNGVPVNYLDNKSGILADGEIYWAREALIDPSQLEEGSTTLTLEWGTPYRDDSAGGGGGAVAGVIQYSLGSGGTVDIAQWIGTRSQYDALSPSVTTSEIEFTITDDQVEISQIEGDTDPYGDSDVQAYLNAQNYVSGAHYNDTNAKSAISDGYISGLGFTKDTQITESQIAGLGFTKDVQIDEAGIASFGFTKNTGTLTSLDGALLQPDLGVSGAATLVTTTSDASEVHTQGTLAVANLVQQEGPSLGVGRAAAAGNIELQNASGNSQIRIYSPNDGTSVIQFRNENTLETSIRQNNDTGVFDILTGGGSAISITGTGITFDRPVSGGGILNITEYTDWFALQGDLASLANHSMIHFTGHLPIFYTNTTVAAPLYFATNAAGNDFFAFYDEADIFPTLTNYDGTNGVASGLSVARTGVALDDAVGTEFRDSANNIYSINGVGGDANYFRTASTLVANITDGQTNGGTAPADLPNNAYLYEHATTTAYFMYDGTNLLRLTQ